jgi:acyl-coenzyme A synthetase/AMP-(fatty) acid ligase
LAGSIRADGNASRSWGGASEYENIAGEVAIVGVPDEILGQAIKAFIVPSPGCELAERQVLKFCSKNLETFAIPKYIEFIEALPKTPNRKVDRKKLKAKALAQFCKTSIKTQKVIH